MAMLCESNLERLGNFPLSPAFGAPGVSVDSLCLHLKFNNYYTW